MNATVHPRATTSVTAPRTLRPPFPPRPLSLTLPPTPPPCLHRPQQLHQGVTAVLSLAVVPEAEEAVSEE